MWVPFPNAGPHWTLGYSTGSSTSQDANGEYRAFIGPIYWRGGKAGDTKVISAAGGGSIYWVPSTLTYATSGTRIRVGLQGVSDLAPDGTYTVYGDHVQGTDALTQGQHVQRTMQSGTKTVSFGDELALVVTMVTRNGSDVFRPGYLSTSGFVSSLGAYPFGVYDASAGPVLDPAAPIPTALIAFDDGAFGYVSLAFPPHLPGSASLHSGLSPNEYGSMFCMEFTAAVSGLVVPVGDLDAGDSASISLWGEAGSTSPTLLQSATINRSAGTSNTPYGAVLRFPRRELHRGQRYALTLYNPNGSGNPIYRHNVTLLNAGFRELLPYGSTLVGVSRTGQSGAFTTSDTVFMPVALIIDEIEISSPIRTRPLKGLR